MGECIDCVIKGDHKIKPLIAGRCRPHYDVYRKFVIFERNKQRAKNGGGKIIKMPEGTILKDLETSIELAKFFKDKIVLIDRNPYCSECNDFIPSQFRRHAVAHILPKSPNSGFPSVATHPLNFLILGAGCGCHNKTHRLDTFSKMKVWPTAVERYLIFRPLVKEKHKLLHEFDSYIK